MSTYTFSNLPRPPLPTSSHLPSAHLHSPPPPNRHHLTSSHISLSSPVISPPPQMQKVRNTVFFTSKRALSPPERHPYLPESPVITIPHRYHPIPNPSKHHESSATSHHLQSSPINLRLTDRPNTTQIPLCRLSSPSAHRFLCSLSARPRSDTKNPFSRVSSQRRPLQDLIPISDHIKYPPYCGYEVLLLGTHRRPSLSTL